MKTRYFKIILRKCSGENRILVRSLYRLRFLSFGCNDALPVLDQVLVVFQQE